LSWIIFIGITSTGKYVLTTILPSRDAYIFYCILEEGFTLAGINGFVESPVLMIYASSVFIFPYVQSPDRLSGPITVCPHDF